MKDKIKYLSQVLAIAIIILTSNHDIVGQDKINITAGIGIPELINIGVRYQYYQTQIGLSVGAMPRGSNEKTTAVSGDFYYHFAGSSSLSNRRPWYGSIGLNYLRDETKSRIHKYLFLNTRIGREINISEKFGINLAVGAIFQLNKEEERKIPLSGWNIDIEIPILPSMGLTLFYRI